jgi:hypothetical protein
MVAGVDAMLDKAAAPDQLFETLRTVARGNAEPLRVAPEVISRCVEDLPPDDVSLFGMAVNRTPAAEIAALAGSDVASTQARLRALIKRLHPRRRDAPALHGG